MNDTRNPPSLIDSLEQDLIEHTQASTAKEIAALRQMLQDTPLPSSSVIVYERPVVLPLFWLLIAAGLIFATPKVNIALFNANYDLSKIDLESFLVDTIWFTIVTIAILCAYKFVRKAVFHWNTPVMTLSEQGVQLRGVEHPIAWQVMDDCEFVHNYFYFLPTSSTVRFQLDYDHVLQWPTKNPSRQIRYFKNRQLVELVIYGISRALKKVPQHITAYRTHVLVRARLAELGQQV